MSEALARWIAARGTASMKWCPRCQKTTVAKEARGTGTGLERVVQKSCEACGGFISQTVLPPLPAPAESKEGEA